MQAITTRGSERFQVPKACRQILLNTFGKDIQDESYLIEGPHFLVWRWSKRLVHVYELQENEGEETEIAQDPTGNREESFCSQKFHYNL